MYVRTYVHTHFHHLYVQYVRKYTYTGIVLVLKFRMAMLSEASCEEITADPLHQNCLGCKQHPTYVFHWTTLV